MDTRELLDRFLSTRRNRLILYYVLAVLGAVVVYTLAYDYGMSRFENEPRSTVEALHVVVETMTTTGYGEDAGTWDSPAVLLLSILMQATGVLFLFTALPVIALPLLQEALETRPPTAIPETEDHVVVCGYDLSVETLIEELGTRDVEYVLLEPDREEAADLYQDGYRVVEGDPETVEDLEAVHAADARSIVVGTTGTVNASIILAARTVAPGVEVVSVTESVERAPYHRYAGADRIFSPRDLVGERLARKATTTVTTDLDRGVEVGEDFEIAELAVHAGSELVGKRLEESGIRERTGANVLGAWIDGEFYHTPLDRPLDEHTVLLVAGGPEQCEALNDLTLSATRPQAAANGAVVAGYGETGRSAARELDEAGIDYTVLDIEDHEGVDIVGDATDPEDLRAAGVEDVGTVVLCLETDADTVFATLVAREVSEDVEIVARANDPGSVRKIYRAGADYVLSLAEVTGRLLAATVLDEDLIAFDTGVKVVRTAADGLAGSTLAGADVRRRTGTTVVAVERNGEVVTGPDPSFELAEDDDVIVAGTEDGIAAFRELEA